MPSALAPMPMARTARKPATASPAAPPTPAAYRASNAMPSCNRGKCGGTRMTSAASSAASPRSMAISSRMQAAARLRRRSEAGAGKPGTGRCFNGPCLMRRLSRMRLPHKPERHDASSACVRVEAASPGTRRARSCAGATQLVAHHAQQPHSQNGILSYFRSLSRLSSANGGRAMCSSWRPRGKPRTSIIASNAGRRVRGSLVIS